MTSDGLDRRSVLKLASGTVAATTVGSLTGCSSVPFIGDGGGTAAYANWAPDPDELGTEHYRCVLTNINGILNHEDKLPDEYVESQKSSFDSRFGSTDLDFEDNANKLLNISSLGIVLKASLTKDDVVKSLTDNEPVEEGDDMSGFTLLKPEEDNASTAWAVSNATVIRAMRTSELDPVESAELLIETNNGEVDTYSDASENFSLAAGQIGGMDYSTAATREKTDEGVVASASGAKINGKKTRAKFVRVYEEATDRQDAQEKLRERQAEAESEEAKSATISGSGRVLTVTATQDTEEWSAGI